jgi:hypothetical protein
MPRMAFVRLLPAAWLASLYASALLLLLVFFLNPYLPLTAASIAASVPMALLLSLPGALAWPAGYRFLRIFARRRLRVRWVSFKVLFGFMGANLLLVSGIYWYNLNLLEALLPDRLLTRLRVAAVLLGCCTLVFLTIAFTKSWRGRPEVRAAFYAAAGLLPVAILGLRGGREVSAAAPYRPSLVGVSAEAPRLLLFGIEGGTLDQVLPMVAQGKLPNLERLLMKGSHGRLTPFRPCVSVVAWESLLTGKMPWKHRVLDAARFTLPLGAGEVRVAPRGFFFHQAARHSGWRESQQRMEESEALHLTDILTRLGFPMSVIRSLPAGARRPPVHLERFLDPQVPTPRETRELRGILKEALEEDGALAAAALDAWRRPEVRGVLVQLPGLDRVSHRFLRYAMPASFGDVPMEEVEKYGHVLEMYYRILDDWIGEFLAADAGAARDAGSLVMVVSPHGIDPLPLGRRALMALEGDRFESGYHGRAPDGLLIASGPGVAHGKPLGKSTILDLAPTLLYHYRLPIGMDMDGHPLTRMFQDEFIATRPILLIPSYEESRLSVAAAPANPP